MRGAGELRGKLYAVVGAALTVALIVGYLVWDSRSLGPIVASWGPLAVTKSENGGDLARIQGVIRLSGRCLVLEVAPGDRRLLTWSEARTRWDSAGRVRHLDPDGVVREAKVGSPVVLSGSGETFRRDGAGEGVTWEEWFDRFDWVAAPDASCDVSGAWTVTAIGAP